MEEVIAKIIELHTHSGEPDEEQLDVIFSNRRKLIIEAPAGYGKTRTMVSKLVYLVAAGQVPHPKRVLALTFSVNAASKIRKELADQIPKTLSTSAISPLEVERKIVTTNFHGFARRVLRRYGYLLDSHLKQMNCLRGIDDSRKPELGRLKIGLTETDIDWLVRFGQAAKEAGEELGTSASMPIKRAFLQANCSLYLQKVKDILLPNGYIPFNAILLLARELFQKYPEIRAFYRSYFRVIVIDEFQDTNILQWTLLQDLIGRGKEISEETYLLLFGDGLQRIYGFIGAIQEIMHIAEKEYGMHQIELKTNHRFKNNRYLLNLDANIRRNAENPQGPNIKNPVTIEFLRAQNQEREAYAILNLVQRLLECEPNAKVAILMRNGHTNNNTKKLLEVFNNSRQGGLSYFYALYSDEDDEYVDFHQVCLDRLQQVLSAGEVVSFRSLGKCLLDNMTKSYSNSSEVYGSLLILLQAFLNQVLKEYTFLTVQDKADLVRDILENKSLKQYLGLVDSHIILSTVHGAKGLEWDYVILPDMEQYSFPSFRGLCRPCQFSDSCHLDFATALSNKEFERDFYQELSVFYVGVTRGRSKTFFSYSQLGLNRNGDDRPNRLSCFLKLQGIHTIG